MKTGAMVCTGLVAVVCFCVAAAGAEKSPPTAKGTGQGTAKNPAAGVQGDETAALAKAAQNPVSSMVSVPIQQNLNLGADRYYLDRDALLTRGLIGRWLSDEQGPDNVLRTRIRNRLLSEWFPVLEKHERTQLVVNIQPVFPASLGNVNLINRLIVPVVDQPIGEDDREFGLGDIQYSMYFSPAKLGRVIWGAGPIISLPTATDDTLGTGKWSVGPAAVVVAMPGPWVIGVLANNQWSFAGDGDRAHVNSMMIQPFVNYNFKSGWYLGSSPIITADWKADSGNRWTVPVGAAVGRVFKVGKQPINAQMGAYYNVEKPDGAAEWNIRFQVQFMFPRKPPVTGKTQKEE